MSPSTFSLTHQTVCWRQLETCSTSTWVNVAGPDKSTQIFFSNLDMIQDVKYVVITPVRDEEKHMEATIEAVAGQTVRPTEWVIVDDGSSDRTGDIIDQYAAKFSWISVVHRSNRGFRKSGGGVVEAFYDGYDRLRCNDWDFVVKLDGDLTFVRTYFEKCFEHFERDPKLGVGG